MALIKILSENLVNQIAAGEVVERPSSVVKELVENSIDAGADRIEVYIKDGGKTFIKVLDNGCGMSREDTELALQRHSTSKISEEKDLWRISTMGFRGEALASISSVSKMVLKSRMEKDLAGTQIDSNGGDIVTIRDFGMSKGTQVEIFDLFFNTPARQKYLKKDSTELGHVTSLLNTIALAHPDIAFKLIHNGKGVFDLAKVTDLISRISDIFGVATADAMIPIFYGGSEFQINGFVGKPLLSRSTGQHQYIFVNGRPIQHYVLAHRIKAAYHSMLMENKKPVFVMNIKIDPSLIDVNVHPTKLEIRFEDQESILRIVYGCVKTALEKTNLIPKFGLKKPGNNRDGKYGATPQEALQFSKEFLKERTQRGFPEGVLRHSQKDPSEDISTDSTKGVRSTSSIQSITQIANSYIVAEDSEGLILIDQHAAHERVRYEQLMDQFENQKKSVQPLLMPQQFELSADEVFLLQDNMEIFAHLGFEIDNFGGNSFVIAAVPAFLSQEDTDAVIKGVLDDISIGKKPQKAQGRTEEIITYMACRSAIKFGQSLSQNEMQGLIEQMGKCKRPYTCPHGRPTMISLTLSELERMFGRK